MEINLHKIEEMKISEFANKHGLVMEVAGYFMLSRRMNPRHEIRKQYRCVG